MVMPIVCWNVKLKSSKGHDNKGESQVAVSIYQSTFDQAENIAKVLTY